MCAAIGRLGASRDYMQHAISSMATGSFLGTVLIHLCIQSCFFGNKIGIERIEYLHNQAYEEEHQTSIALGIVANANAIYADTWARMLASSIAARVFQSLGLSLTDPGFGTRARTVPSSSRNVS